MVDATACPTTLLVESQPRPPLCWPERWSPSLLLLFLETKMALTATMTSTTTMVETTVTAAPMDAHDLERIQRFDTTGFIQDLIQNCYVEAHNLAWIQIRRMQETYMVWSIAYIQGQRGFQLFKSDYMIHRHMIGFINQESFVNTYSLTLFDKKY